MDHGSFSQMEPHREVLGALRRLHERHKLAISTKSDYDLSDLLFNTAGC
jgi:hypothetical protein